MKINKLRGVSGAAAGILLLISGQGAVFAATAAPKTKAAPVAQNQTLKISPLRSDVTIAPGGAGKVQMYVSNITKNTIIIQPVENDFVAGDEKGTPALILDPNSFASTHSLKRFMKPLANVTVAPGTTQEVDLTISVPKTAQAGGYYGAVRFAPVTSGSQSLSLGSSAASLVLLTVPGPTVEKLTMTNFDIQQNGGTASNFRTPNNLQLLLRFKNEGNLQEAPFGQVYVQKGKKVVYTYSFNQGSIKDQILPDSARRWLVPLKGFGKFGKYTVGATFTYGSKNQTIEIVKSVWIIPTVYILIVVGIVALLAVIVAAFWFMARNYKRRILKSSRRRY